MSITHYPSAKCSVHSIDHYALDVPDLALAQIFFEAFGLLVERREPGLRLRTAHSDHVWASILQGNAKQLSYLCFNCRVGELDRIHDQALGAGGKKAPPHPLALHSDGFWFRDPDGNLIQVRVGPKTMPDASSIGQVPPRANHDRGVLSRSAAKKIYPTRLSHVLLYSADVEGQIGFYTRSIGLGLSDKAQDLIAFMHGRHGSDHHLLAFAKSHTRGWHHASWDVPGIEEVGLGWMQMQRAGFDRVWGPGRHVLGSNYFCYVRDPWGSYCEYSSDIDYVPEGHVWPSGDFQQEDSLYLWGPAVPPDFVSNTEIHDDDTELKINTAE